MLGRKPKPYQLRLSKMSQSELQLQGEASMFVIGRALNDMRSDHLKDAAQALLVLSGVLDALIDRRAFDRR